MGTLVLVLPAAVLRSEQMLPLVWSSIQPRLQEQMMMSPGDMERSSKATGGPAPALSALGARGWRR